MSRQCRCEDMHRVKNQRIRSALTYLDDIGQLLCLLLQLPGRLSQLLLPILQLQSSTVFFQLHVRHQRAVGVTSSHLHLGTGFQRDLPRNLRMVWQVEAYNNSSHYHEKAQYHTKHDSLHGDVKILEIHVLHTWQLGQVGGMDWRKQTAWQAPWHKWHIFMSPPCPQTTHFRAARC